MIIKARHHPLIYPFFTCYSVYQTRRNFKDVVISGDYQEKNLPLLLLSNHISWWDGFWAVYLNVKLFHRRFHFMMLEEQLRKYSFFIKSGGYSVKKGSRSVIESIEYTSELLSDNKNMVLLFPQGRISSMHQHSIIFEKGIERVLEKIKGKAQVIFMANIVDYFSYKKPSLFIYLKEYNNIDKETGTAEKEYNDFFSSCVNENLKIT